MCLQSMTSLPPNCTVSRSRQVLYIREFNDTHFISDSLKILCTELWLSDVWGFLKTVKCMCNNKKNTQWTLPVLLSPNVHVSHSVEKEHFFHLTHVYLFFFFAFSNLCTIQWQPNRVSQIQRGRRHGRKWTMIESMRLKLQLFASWSPERRCSTMS